MQEAIPAWEQRKSSCAEKKPSEDSSWAICKSQPDLKTERGFQLSKGLVAVVSGLSADRSTISLYCPKVRIGGLLVADLYLLYLLLICRT